MFIINRACRSLTAAGCVALLVTACGGTSAGPFDPGGVGGTGASGGTSSGAGASGSVAQAGRAGNMGGTSSGGATSGGAGNGGNTGSTAGCNQPTITTATPCNGQYPATSIKALRGAQSVGCFELSHVGLVARTDSPTEPRIYVQDAGGTDTSAISAKCAATATHACDAAVRAKIPALLDTPTDGAQLTVRGYYQHGSVTGFEEFYIEDIIDECKAVPRPPPITLSVADITRDARTPSKWFRRATVAIPAGDPLVVYDFSPAELLLAQPQCPDYAGFAMISKSAGTAAPATCAGATNPAPLMQANPREVLIGRQFFNQFLFAADCACAATSNIRIVGAKGQVSGNVVGYLILEQEKASTAAYQVFEPAADQTFPIH